MFTKFFTVRLHQNYENQEVTTKPDLQGGSYIKNCYFHDIRGDSASSIISTSANQGSVPDLNIENCYFNKVVTESYYTIYAEGVSVLLFNCFLECKTTATDTKSTSIFYNRYEKKSRFESNSVMKSDEGNYLIFAMKAEFKQNNFTSNQPKLCAVNYNKFDTKITSSFFVNTAPTDSTALYLQSFSEIELAIFYNNPGTGLSLKDSTITIKNCTFIRNTQNDIFLDTSTATISFCQFSNMKVNDPEKITKDNTNFLEGSGVPSNMIPNLSNGAQIGQNKYFCFNTQFEGESYEPNTPTPNSDCEPDVQERLKYKRIKYIFALGSAAQSI
ncbi:hypothetical protein TVAG_078580 [Trichomonas vaginalis G3]|uniref:Right handed beta helix domain-containing protein n=1 Tax=Trichomonas vaginalis (strain ATCC PRA-98 / G3) TaxID=412133 RepID=A2FIV4_TRIV3|nr:pectin lyase-like family [Trichomonas vaginalis G3]EAX95169.1 hypothetical protein TVAG_078580 [Trichomonas vaginalis G3]KAI5514509.1 pectin lyase-like family [Trichomonas vaginalis G3]|eukprot:XP_001308099.1 hypothetical protein [Trichomonas vaginalis G3]